MAPERAGGSGLFWCLTFPVTSFKATSLHPCPAMLKMRAWTLGMEILMSWESVVEADTQRCVMLGMCQSLTALGGSQVRVMSP